MKIETIRLKNFKVFQNLEIRDLPKLAIFVGANGSGKSTLFEVFAFLSEALSGNVRSALAGRGGFREVKSRDSEGNVEIELQFRLEISGRERLVTYLLEISEEAGRPVVAREILKYKRGRYGSPYHFLDFARGSGTAITNEEDFDKSDEELEREEQKLGSPDILAIKGLGQFDRFKAASAFRSFIENWHVSDFHISEARPVREAGYAEHLSPRGDNLALVAQFMFENHREVFDALLEKMAQRVPGVQKVEAKLTEDGRIVLRFQDGNFKDPFVARFVSDGTIKMFAYLLMLHDPQPHPLLCIEEPENQLYPTLLPELLEEFRMYANKGGQVFVTSHSPDFLNAAEADEVFWLDKREGYTQIRRASDDPFISAQVKAGNPLGYLWKSNMFEGSHPNG
ncbi:putative ATPase [Cyclonatronum proteinivorum]|uniref:Putative ATPase n=1 Tax=Cyclonatronum proteinivorum TaxID=1457365 RepID=A0A345UJQ5_9BACT|nr:AAA family ATPase [Cyclonatronum proteinivorum]AXJ00707.1 putative ATPase [Cyclonatronum proteinivorum]